MYVQTETSPHCMHAVASWLAGTNLSLDDTKWSEIRWEAVTRHVDITGHYDRTEPHLTLAGKDELT